MIQLGSGPYICPTWYNNAGLGSFIYFQSNLSQLLISHNYTSIIITWGVPPVAFYHICYHASKVKDRYAKKKNHLELHFSLLNAK